MSHFKINSTIYRRAYMPYWDAYRSNNYLIPGIKHYVNIYGGFEPMYDEPVSEPFDEKGYLRYKISTCGVTIEKSIF